MNAYLLTLILFYADFTGEPYYKLIERNWGQSYSMPVAWEQHLVQYGDINCSGKVDPNDLWDLSGITNQCIGWAVNSDTAHPYLDCYQLNRSSKVKTIRECKKICLTCLSRKVN